MQCEISKIRFESPETIDKIFISSDNTIALTDKEGGVRLYKMDDDNDEPNLITSYQDHKGPVMDAAFISITHPFYVLTCSYDRSISLRSKEAQMFSYKEDDASMGFFVSCTFVKTEEEFLRFLVGTSNGYIYDFDSRSDFVPAKHSLFNETIVSLEAIDDECILICSNSSTPRIYVDKNFAEFVSVDTEILTEKFKETRMTGNRHETSLLLVSENGKIELSRFNRNSKEITNEAQFNLNQKVLASAWSFSKHSANIIVVDSQNNSFQTKTVKEDLNNPGTWSLLEINSEVLE